MKRGASWNESGCARLVRWQAEMVSYLVLDEKAISRGHSYMTLVTDLDGRRSLKVTPERNIQSLVTASIPWGPFSLDRYVGILTHGN
jgi:hypothetical protein